MPAGDITDVYYKNQKPKDKIKESFMNTYVPWDFYGMTGQFVKETIIICGGQYARVNSDGKYVGARSNLCVEYDFRENQ